MKNIYKKIKDTILENYKSMVLFAVLYIILMWPLDYYIITGGGIMEIGDRIVVEDEYESKGSFNLSYVSEIKGTVSTYLLSYVMPNWERVDATDYTYDDGETKEDIAFRGKIDLLVSSDNAIRNAFKKADKTYKITDNYVYVYYVDKDSKTNLKVGDKIIKIGDKEISSLENFKNLLENYNLNDSIKLTIERNNKEKEVVASLYEKDGKKMLGIYLYEVHKYKTYPKVKIDFNEGESGPSGGLMEALDIYNKITKEDITKGLKIAGTGEIDANGNIGTIGGVKYKLLGAVKKKADIFLVPKGENYKTCMKVAKKNKLDIKIIGVSTLDEAISELEKL